MHNHLSGFSFINWLGGIAIFSLLSFTAYCEEWKIQSLDFDGTAIKLAIPANFITAAQDDQRMVITRKALPSSNLLVTGFLSPEDNFRYCLVQQIVQTKNWRYNATDWQQILGEFDSVMKNLSPSEISDMINRRAAEAIGPEIPGAAIRIEKPVILPVVDSSDHHITFPMLIAVNSEQTNSKTRSVAVVACTIFALNERMVHVFLYEPFVGKETYAVITEKSREMARLTLAANNSPKQIQETTK